MRQTTTVGDPHIAESDLGPFFTLKQQWKRPYRHQWKTVQYKMLISYHDQRMFSEHMEAPMNDNIHHMLWHYLIKMCGTCKARMVCDGSPCQDTRTLGHTFANSLDAPSERLFWAIVVKKGLTAFGTDCSNEAYCDWWENHLGNPLISYEKTALCINYAIQGHPESPRL